MNDNVTLYAIQNQKLDTHKMLVFHEHLMVSQNINSAIEHLVKCGQNPNNGKSAKIAVAALDLAFTILYNCCTLTASERFEKFTTPNMN